MGRPLPPTPTLNRRSVQHDSGIVTAAADGVAPTMPEALPDGDGAREDADGDGDMPPTDLSLQHFSAVLAKVDLRIGLLLA